VASRLGQAGHQAIHKEDAVMKCHLFSVARSFLAFLCLAMAPFQALAQNYSDIWWNPGPSGTLPLLTSNKCPA
jgi:hypothetical protein